MGVDRLLSVTETLEAPRIFERSVKLTKGAFSTDRGLVSMDKHALYPGPSTQLREICAALGCPDSAPLEPHLSAACAVHFGADEEIGKCYLEFRPADAPETDLIFIALKWRGQSQRLNRYKTVSHWRHSEKQDLIREHVPNENVAGVMLRCLDLARDGDPDGEAVVLHVTEEQSNRVSVDISVADAKSDLAAAADVLAPLQMSFGEGLQALLTEYPQASFGHIAAGVGSDGQPFVTIYYGAKAL